MADSTWTVVSTQRGLWRAMHDGAERIEVRGPLVGKVAAGLAQAAATPAFTGGTLGAAALSKGPVPWPVQIAVATGVVVGVLGLTYVLARLARDYDEVRFEFSYKGAKGSAHYRRKQTKT